MRIPERQLEKLGRDEGIRAMLRSRALREKLVMIDNSKQRMTEVMEAMREEEFQGLFGRMMEVVFEGREMEEE